jgi:lysophospholipase L1-like esterase
VPKQVIVYAGENDIAEGAQPAEVLAAFVRFVQVVQAERPGTPIAFVSIKPSPLRAAQTALMREANLLVQTWVLAQEGLDYIDVHTPMLDNDGRARPELFVRDRLHLSAEGYALWRQVISAHLKP